MRRPEGGWGRFVPAFLVSACAGLLFLAFAKNYAPFLRYPYDWDASDGDMFNATLRILRGLPLYGSWDEGTIPFLYLPLLNYLHALISKLGFSLSGSLRPLLLFCFMGAVCLASLIPRLPGVEIKKRITGSALTLIIIFSASYDHLRFLRTDALLVFLQMATCLVLARWPEKATFVALLSVLTVFSKQSGIATPLACGLYYLVARRDLFAKYAVAGFLFLGAVIGFLEAKNDGHFIRSAFLMPGSTFDTDILDWRHTAWTFEAFYEKRLWLVPFALFAMARGLKTRLLPLILFWAVDLVLELKLTRNNAGGTSYLWSHWFLISAFASIGICQVSELGMRRLSSPAGRAALGWAPSLCGIAMLFLFSRGMFRQPVDLTVSHQISRDHEALIRKIVEKHPDAKWAAQRQVSAIIAAGKTIDQEWCTLELAYRESRGRNADRLVRRLMSGEYQLIQTSPSHCTVDGRAGNRRIAQAIEACYAPLAESHVVSYGSPSPVTIRRFDPGRSGCTALR